MRLSYFLPVLSLFGICLPLAADFQQGMDAYNSGNYIKAFNEWLLVASDTEGTVSPVEQANPYEKE